MRPGGNEKRGGELATHLSGRRSESKSEIEGENAGAMLKPKESSAVLQRIRKDKVHTDYTPKTK